jgi:hypothetical protein
MAAWTSAVSHSCRLLVNPELSGLYLAMAGLDGDKPAQQGSGATGAVLLGRICAGVGIR